MKNFTLKSRQQLTNQLSDWYQQDSGKSMLKQIDTVLKNQLATYSGYFGIEFGFLDCGQQWLDSTNIKHRYYLGSQQSDIIADFENLPLAAETADCVLATHVLEFVGQPHQVLREIDRILIPEGKLVLLVFNPYSIQGLRKVFQSNERVPETGHFYPVWRLKEWLSVLGFGVQSVNYIAPAFTIPENLDLTKNVVDHFFSWTGRVAIITATKKISRIIPVHAESKLPSLLKKRVIQPTTFNTELQTNEKTKHLH